MSSIDDMPEHYREDFEGYEPDPPYYAAIKEMAYYMESNSFFPRRYGINEPPTNEEVLHFNKLLENANSNIKSLTMSDKFTLAWHYEHGIDSNLSNITNGKGKPNYKDAIRFYNDIYKEGSKSKETGENFAGEDFLMAINAAHQIGVLHEKGGYGIRKDYRRAAEWYLKGIELQKPESQKRYFIPGKRSSHITLARLYIEGLGVEEDHIKAIKILSKFETDDYVFPSFDNDVANNEALKCFLFSKIYSYDSIKGRYFTKTYGYLYKNDFVEEGYFMSINDQRKLWKKWIKKAIDLDYSDAINDYAAGLDRSFELEFLDPKNKDAFIEAYEDTIESVHYYMRLNNLEIGIEDLDEDQQMDTLNPMINSIHQFALKAQKYDELTKDEK